MDSETAGKGVAMLPMSTTTFQVSVVLCKKTGRVLFLEAGKDFVDTLLSFLLLPVGTIIHMLSTGPVQVKPFGGISSIFESVKNLDCSLLHQSLVEPNPAAVGTCGSTGLLQGLEAAKSTPTPGFKKFAIFPTTYYGCTNCDYCANLSTKRGARCEPCLLFYGLNHYYKKEMPVLPKDIQELEAVIGTVENPDFEEASCSTGIDGFVRENIAYMVTDSLEIIPSTAIRSIIEMLNNLKATLADLESNDTTVSITQVHQLLQSAMTSSSCLNEVFGPQLSAGRAFQWPHSGF